MRDKTARLQKKRKTSNIASAIDDDHVEKPMQINTEYVEASTSSQGRKKGGEERKNVEFENKEDVHEHHLSGVYIDRGPPCEEKVED